MKQFTIKHGKYKQKQTGCDYCGELVEVTGFPARKNWQKIKLCKDCYPNVSAEHKKMRNERINYPLSV